MEPACAGCRKAESPPILPRVTFAGTSVSRMLLGGNPFSGVAHRPEDPDAGRRLREYFTDDKVLETMTIAVQVGINAFHGRGDSNVFRWLDNYRAWADREPNRPVLHWLGQTAPDQYVDGRVEPNIDTMAGHGPMAIYVHGATGDKCHEEGRLEYLRDLVAHIKGLGLTAGIGSHRPAVIRAAEEAGLGTDFYVLSLRHIRQSPDICRDEQWAAETIRSIAKPFVAIKALGAGRLQPEACFRYAAQVLKPTDVVTVGMRDYEVVPNVRLAASAFAAQEAANA
ncbi:MAG: hypothetical protein GXX93_11935 [Anaerolineae bacterium]|nr:hypothetical protein [Anaerolineae bacterium]